MESAALAAERLLDPGHRVGEGARPLGMGHVGEPAPEGRPVRRHDVTAGDLVTGPEGEGMKPVVVEVVEGGADDPVLGKQARLRETEQAREELAPGQVAGGAEQDDDMRMT